MTWGLKKIKTLPTDDIEEFLIHALERKTIEEALESVVILKEKYKLTDALNEEEQNDNYNFMLKLSGLQLVKINTDTLIKEY